MANHLFLPLVVPMLGAALAVMSGRQRMIARSIVILTVAFNVIYGGWLILEVGAQGRQVAQGAGWLAPFGISLVADGFSAIMLFVASLLLLTTLIYSYASLEKQFEQYFFYPLLLLLLLGVSGAFLTGDLFNLYVWFEVLLLASFGLLTMGGSRPQLEGGMKYVFLNLIGSTSFLIGCGLVYGVAGTLNMAHLSERLLTIQQPGLVTAIACLFLFSFGSKAGIFPLFYWLPASYHTPPVAVTAIFSGLMTKVGIYSLYRIFGLFFQNELQHLAPFILLIAGLTMVIGVFGAVAQTDIRRILSFHIISQIGYAVMGLGLASVAGLAAGIIFLAHVMIVKSALFYIGGAAEQIYGTAELKKRAGLAKREPLLAILWFLGILSLAGIPPLSGFFGKLGLLQAGVDETRWIITGVAAGTGVLTFFSMLKIWNEVFWKKAYTDVSKLPRVSPGLMLPGLILVLASVTMGISADAVMEYATMAAGQAFDPGSYVVDVCGAGGCDQLLSAAGSVEQ